MDQGQTTCWNSWMRGTPISMLATIVLAVTRARTTTAAPSGQAARARRRWNNTTATATT